MARKARGKPSRRPPGIQGLRVKASFPEAFRFLFTPKRYKAPHGGRGSAKSWSIAEALILLALEPKLLFPKATKIRILCTREIQNSIKESVHKLLSDTIERLGLGKIFVVTASSIVCHNGSEFIFMGLLRNVDQIKSTEGINICWVSEAHNVSDESWELLLPTIRAEDSEIWIDFNPKFEHDPTYQKWVANPPENCVSPLINYTDNPYFPEVLRIEMEQDKAKDFKLYEQKWLGKPMGMGGRVWTAFEKTIHVREFDPVEMAKTGNFYHGQDPHAHYYPANGWMCVFPLNERRNWPEDFHFHIYNEWPTVEGLGGFYHDMRKKLTFNGTLEDLAKEIYAGDGVEYGFKVRKRGIDTRFAKGSGGWNWATGTTQGIVEQYAKKENGGLQFTMPQESMIDSQRQLIHKLMDYNRMIPIGPYNMPQFSIHPRCKNIIASFTSHRLEEDSEKESEKFKDFSDMVRIMFAVVDRWVDPSPKPKPVYISRSGSSFG